MRIAVVFFIALRLLFCLGFSAFVVSYDLVSSPESIWESCPRLCFIKEFEHSVYPEQPVDPYDDGARYLLVTGSVE